MQTPSLRKRLDNKYSFQAVIDAVRNYTNTNIDHDIYLQSFRNDVIDSFEKEFNIELSKKFKTLPEIKNFKKELINFEIFYFYHIFL